MSAFQGATNTTITGGTFTVVSHTYTNIFTQTDIVSVLHSHSATSGLLDAKERFDAPKCYEGTQTSMLRGMKNFVQEGGPLSSPALYWLHGPAGVGKSALSQSLSLSLQSEDNHAASFFFSRTAPGRNNGNQLIMTLAYQVAINIPALQVPMSKTVRRNPAILTTSNAAQMQSLIIDPINEWKKKHRGSVMRWAHKFLKTDRNSHPRLILVDGLDECNDPAVQRDLLLCIGYAVRKLSLPFWFVITSRPESHIRATFELDPIFQRPNGVKVILKDLGDDEEVDKQINSFLLKEFAKIRQAHPKCRSLPQQWPQPGQISWLVFKSSKGFIFPATVMQYIGMSKNRPDKCLERLLALLDVPTQETPYELLDHLYRHILESIPNNNKDAIHKIFHFLVVPGVSERCVTPQIIEKCLNFKFGHVRHILQDLLCIISFTTIQEPIKFLHASLPDFLLDQSRSGSLSINIADTHAMVAASFYKIHGPGCGLKTKLFSQFLNHFLLATITEDLLKVLLAVNLGKEYVEICENLISDCKSTEPRYDQLAGLLECASYIIASPE